MFKKILYSFVITAFIVLFSAPLQAKTLKGPKEFEMFYVLKHKLGEKPDFEKMAAEELKYKNFNEFEKKREIEKKAKEFEDQFADYSDYDRIVMNVDQRISDYDFDRELFLNPTFSPTTFFPFRSKYGEAPLYFENADEFYTLKMSSDEAEQFLSKLSDRRISMVITVYLNGVKDERGEQSFNGFVEEVQYFNNPYSYREQGQLIKTVKTERQPKDLSVKEAPKYSKSSEDMDPEDFDYRGLKLGMTVTEFIDWAKENNDLGKRPKISKSLRDYSLPKKKESGLFGDSDWAYMDSNIKAVKINSFDFDRVTCSVGTFCADAKFDEDGELISIHFRDSFKDADKDDVIDKLQEKYGSAVIDKDARVGTSGNLYQSGVTSLRSKFLGFGEQSDDVKPFFKEVEENVAHPLTLRIAQSYKSVYIEGHLNNMKDLPEPKEPKGKKEVKF